jgi:transcriptional regulator with XRE-family HTH domain
MDQVTRRLELRKLLVKCRARVTPEDVGLPVTLRRRVAGLRREEVAELVGVTTNWYTLFETGSPDRRFSSAFVERVAEALRLDEHERALLLRLALPEVRMAVEQFERSAYDGTLHHLQGVRSLVRRVMAASTFAEATTAAVESVLEALSPSAVAAAILLPDGDLPRIIALGPRANAELKDSAVPDACMVINYPNRYGHTTFSENRPAYRKTLGGLCDFEQRTYIGSSFCVNVTGSAPTAKSTLERQLFTDVKVDGVFNDVNLDVSEYWDWNAKVDIQSTVTHGLFTDGNYRGNLVALWAEPRAVASLDTEILRTASAIVELAAHSGTAPRKRASSSTTNPAT